MDPTPFSTLGVSTLAVAIAEIGDKTQLLALLLAARFRRPWPIVAGILVATLLNHALAGWLGALIAGLLSPDTLRWLVAGSFAAIGLWTLKPDKIDDDSGALPGRGAFIATTVAFFFAEIGDKTQIATVVLAAKSPALWPVVAGTTLGMLLANVPVVVLGSRFAEKLPLRAARLAAAALFLGLAAWVGLRGVPADTHCADGKGTGMLCADTNDPPRSP
ncbi:MAG: TMEM165/GDT1 family protein [Pseudomonadota bacterium]|jgi:putative Ca2+/H+ antiporter (TMEM165/GDT1 family)